MDWGLIDRADNRNRVDTARASLSPLDTELQLGIVVVRRYRQGTKFPVGICVGLRSLKGKNALLDMQLQARMTLPLDNNSPLNTHPGEGYWPHTVSGHHNKCEPRRVSTSS